jgi:transcriptional accessory protein Tex/SPT6
VKTVNAAKYVDEKFGLPTVQDILKELEKPGRDPRPSSRPPPSAKASRSFPTSSRA